MAVIAWARSGGSGGPPAGAQEPEPTQPPHETPTPPQQQTPTLTPTPCRCTLNLRGIGLTEILNNHARFIVQKDAFCSGTCTEGECSCKTKCTWTCDNRDQRNATCGIAFGGDDCQFDVKIHQCPAKIKLKVKVRVECFCDGVAVGGEGGVCEKEIEQSFDIQCCRCLQPQVDGDIAGTGTATKTTWKPPSVKPRCGTCSANNRPCRPENVTCSWSVLALEGTASIDGPENDCGGVTVTHSEDAQYFMQLFVSWECVGCEHRTSCFKHFAWTAKGTKAKLEPEEN